MDFIPYMMFNFLIFTQTWDLDSQLDFQQSLPQV